MLVPSAQLPEGFYKRPQDFSKFLFVAEVHKWEERSKVVCRILSIDKSTLLDGTCQALSVSGQIWRH